LPGAGARRGGRCPPFRHPASRPAPGGKGRLEAAASGHTRKTIDGECSNFHSRAVGADVRARPCSGDSPQSHIDGKTRGREETEGTKSHSSNIVSPLGWDLHEIRGVPCPVNQSHSWVASVRIGRKVRKQQPSRWQLNGAARAVHANHSDDRLIPAD
jgi:hypothetical protein